MNKEGPKSLGTHSKGLNLTSVSIRMVSEGGSRDRDASFFSLPPQLRSIWSQAQGGFKIGQGDLVMF